MSCLVCALRWQQLDFWPELLRSEFLHIRYDWRLRKRLRAVRLAIA